MPSTTLLGAFGQGNFGDEWILQRAMERYPQARVLSRGELPPGVEKARGIAPFLVLPGGALFQDKTSPFSFWWYLFQVVVHLWGGARVIAQDQDLSELKNGWLRDWIRWIIQHPRVSFAMRPGERVIWDTIEGKDGVNPLNLSVAPTKEHLWVPSPWSSQPPTSFDGLFFSDGRGDWEKEEVAVYRHQPGKVDRSAQFILDHHHITSARYHPLLLAWMAGRPALAIGPEHGKLHHLAQRAGYPWGEECSSDLVPHPPTQVWGP